jgi:mannose-6-phosphate isomerase
VNRRPLVLPPNQFHRFYSGGARIDALRGVPEGEDGRPEDWIGSTATSFGSPTEGLSHLEDGTVLKDLIAANADDFLGPEHTRRYGADPALLVKLLDAGERLPVHCHPSRAFARRHLDCAFGKTEAWVVVEAKGERPLVHLGFRDDVDATTLAGWVERQETTAMLGELNALEVRRGDAIFVPAGVPHSIGDGVFLVELQEPTDFSVLLEWDGFAVDGTVGGRLGIGDDLALSCVDRSGLGEDALAHLHRRTGDAREVRPGVWDVLAADADPYFRAERLLPRPSATLEPAFSILVVLDGHGRLETEYGGALTLARGATVLLPYASGSGRISGQVEAIRCLPPAAGLSAPVT